MRSFNVGSRKAACLNNPSPTLPHNIYRTEYKNPDEVDVMPVEAAHLHRQRGHGRPPESQGPHQKGRQDADAGQDMKPVEAGESEEDGAVGVLPGPEARMVPLPPLDAQEDGSQEHGNDEGRCQPLPSSLGPVDGPLHRHAAGEQNDSVDKNERQLQLDAFGRPDGALAPEVKVGREQAPEEKGL